MWLKKTPIQLVGFNWVGRVGGNIDIFNVGLKWLLYISADFYIYLKNRINVNVYL